MWEYRNDVLQGCDVDRCQDWFDGAWSLGSPMKISIKYCKVSPQTTLCKRMQCLIFCSRERVDISVLILFIHFTAVY